MVIVSISGCASGSGKLWIDGWRIDGPCVLIRYFDSDGNELNRRGIPNPKVRRRRIRITTGSDPLTVGLLAWLAWIVARS